MLPFAARHHFLEHGWTLVRNVLDPSTTHALHAASQEAASARWKQLCAVPSIDVIFRRRQSKFSDPPLQHMVTHLEKRRFLLQYFRKVRRQRKEQRRMVNEVLGGRKKEDLTEEEIRKLSAVLQEKVLKSGQKYSSISFDSTIYNDPQMLQAINEYRSNLWMTYQPLEALLRSSAVTGALGKLAEEIAGIEKPVVFGDSPLLRDAFGGGVGYQCTAPLFGVRTTKCRPNVAVTLIPFTFAPTRFCLEPHVLTRPFSSAFSFSSFPSCCNVNCSALPSHRFVHSFLLGDGKSSRRRGGRHKGAAERLQALFSPFLLNEYHIPFQLQHLLQCGVPPEGVSQTSSHSECGVPSKVVHRHWRGESLLSLCSLPTSQNTVEGNPAAHCRDSSIVAGDVLVVDPHLLLAFGPNLTSRPEVVYRVNVVSQSTKPFMGSPSWIRGWRSLPQEVNFAAPKVFPPLESTLARS